jgi:hypothetical protein
MSTYVSQILTSTKSIISTELGSDYQALRYIYNVELNGLRGAYKAYGVRPLAASSNETICRNYTLDHQFEVILTDTFARADNDSQIETSIGTMYNKADEIFKELVNQKIGLSSFVLNVFDPSISEPELLGDQKFVILRMQYTIKYRSALNL